MLSVLNRRRQVLMQPEGDALAEWLNSHQKSRLAQHLRFFLMFREVEMTSLHPGFHKAMQVPPPDALALAKMFSKKRRAREKPFNPATPYAIHVRLDLLPERSGTYRMNLTPTGKSDRALLLVMQLAGARMLHHLRLCDHCRKWLFQRKGDQRFCGEACRKAFWETSEDAKEQRKLYKRKYRADLRERREKERRLR